MSINWEMTRIITEESIRNHLYTLFYPKMNSGTNTGFGYQMVPTTGSNAGTGYKIFHQPLVKNIISKIRIEAYTGTYIFHY